ncbi:MAG: hypothetical protein LBP92_07595 [Deltaproteobacteria bacterium]|jgi:hypothetical protein|nr:hypothetical protein [Deltaproteobacteria bacterium]
MADYGEPALILTCFGPGDLGPKEILVFYCFAVKKKMSLAQGKSVYFY